MVEVFRTNLDTEEQADFILANLGRAFPDCVINFNLEDCDNILRVERHDTVIETGPIIGMVKGLGYEIEVLPDGMPHFDDEVGRK